MEKSCEKLQRKTAQCDERQNVPNISPEALKLTNSVVLEAHIFSDSTIFCPVTNIYADLEFPSGIKLLQALDCLLSVHHGGHC